MSHDETIQHCWKYVVNNIIMYIYYWKVWFYCVKLLPNGVFGFCAQVIRRNGKLFELIKKERLIKKSSIFKNLNQ